MRKDEPVGGVTYGARGARSALAPLALLLEIVAALSLLASAALAQGRATLLSVRGDAAVRRSGAVSFVNAARKMQVSAGDLIRTGANGRVLLLFADGSQVKVNAGTVLLIPETPPRQGIPPRMGLSAGEIWARVTRGRRVTIETPTAAAAVRGTDLNLKVAEDGTATLTVGEGEVRFFNELGSVLVRESQQSVARPGQPPTPPITVNVPFIIEWINDVQPVALVLEGFYVSQDPARLATALEEAEALAPGPERWRRLGDVHHDRGELQEALAAYEAGLAALGQAEEAVAARAEMEARIGQTLLELGRAPEAEVAFRRALARFSQARGEAASPVVEETRGRAGLVMALISQRDLATAALQEARAATNADERSPIAHTALGLVQLRLGEREAARRSLEQALALDDGYAQAHAWRSFLLRAEGRLEAAGESARRAVALAPHSSLARQSLSDVLFAQGQTREAREEASLAVRLNPLSPGARVSLGRALLQEGKLTQAVYQAHQAVALDPDLDRAQFFLGAVLAEQRRLERAATALERAVARDPGYLEARAFLARVYLEQGRRGEAVAVAREAVARDPDFAPAHAALGRIYWRAGRLKEAADQYRTALRLQPGSALYHLELARVYLDLNNLPDALANGLAAANAAPTSGEARAVLGLIYDRMDNQAQALQRYREALALAPENALARLGFGLQNPSSEDGLREIGQAMLRDPSVLALIFKPGVTTEIAPGTGSHERRGLSVFHRDQYARGRLHDFSFAVPEWSANPRDRRNERSALVQTNLAAEPGYRDHLLGQYSFFGNKSALAGPVFDPDPDDRLSFWQNEGRLGWRRQATPDTFLWLGLDRSVLNSALRNPGAPTDGEPTALSRTRFSRTGVEGRLDHRWGRGHTTSYVFFAGRGHTGNRTREYEPLQARFSETDLLVRTNAVTHTLQEEYRPHPRLSLIAGVTAERFTERARAVFDDGRTLRLPDRGETNWLPYGLVTYVPTPRDAVRVLAHRRRNRLVEGTLQPTEAFLVGELPAVAAGGRATNYELNLEHRFSARSFAKFFFFHSDVDGFRVDPGRGQSLSPVGFTVPRARVQGVGMRYERQIGLYLSSYLQGSYSETQDRTGTPTRGRQLPLNPRWRATLGLNFIDRAGTKLFLEANWNGPRFLDPIWSDRPEFDPLARRPEEASKLVVNFRFAKERTVRGEWVVAINNLFNTATLSWPGFPRPGRTVHVQYRWRF